MPTIPITAGPVPARGRLLAACPAARPCRSHRRSHRGAAAPLHHRARARRRAAGRLQDPTRLPVPALRRGLPRRHLSAHPRRAERRQRSSATVAQHPCVFATLTAPSFGPVHSRREKDGRILSIGPADAAGTARTATPCRAGSATAATTRCSASRCVQDCYDDTGSVLFNASCSRTLAALHHHPAPGARPPGRDDRPPPPWPRSCASPTPRSPNTSAAAWSTSTPSSGSTARRARDRPTRRATFDMLADAIVQAASTVHLETPAAPGLPARTL